MTRILIVDDEPDITLSFKMILEGNGFKVDTYNDPVHAKGNFKAGVIRSCYFGYPDAQNGRISAV